MQRCRITEPTQVKQYHKVLIEMMTYLNGVAYTQAHEFSSEELERLKPHDIYRWMAWKVYGTDDPSPQDNPTEGRSTSLKYYKKAISFYMPNRRMQWNEVTKAGNPTRSEDINNLIQAAIAKECRKQGKPSRADRGFERSEMEQAFSILQSFPDLPTKRKFPAMFKFQFHLIACLDDTCHVKRENLTHCFQFSFALTIQIRWSKKIRDEQDAPQQIILGAMDACYCVLLALATFLEEWIEDGDGQLTDYLFVMRGRLLRR